MAGLRVIILGLLAVSCSAHFGYNHDHGDFTRQQQFQPSQPNPREKINNFLNKFGVRADDQKCFTLTKRPFYMTKLMQYPCYKRMRGVPVVKSFMGPFGPMCMSYFREKVYRYFKIQTCCPGFAMDKMGKCSIRVQRNKQSSFFKPSQPSQQISQQSRRNMMDMASKARQNMLQRANDAMKQRRNMLFANYNRMRQPFRPPMPMRQQMRPPMSPPMTPFMNMYNRRQEQQRPKIAFLRFNKFGQPPMPRPLPRPPMTRFIKLFKPRAFTGKFMMAMPFRGIHIPAHQLRKLPQQQSPPPQQQQQLQQQQRQVPTRILSNRMPFGPFRSMNEFHPRMPQIPNQARVQPMYPNQPYTQRFPQIPNTNGNNQQNVQRGYNNQMQVTQDFNAPETQEVQGEPDIQVNLPDQPVQMPDLIVEEGPMNQENANALSCVVRLETGVETCLRKNNIDVPDLMTAFEPFNDDLSLLLCRAESAIFDCVENEIKDCRNSDASIARDMLTETAETVRSMCELREVSVATETFETQPALSSTELKGTETIATVESVDAIPAAENKVEPPAIIVEEKKAVDNKPTESTSFAASQQEAMQEAIEHEVHVQELRMKEYLLPILIGSGVGFFVIMLIFSLMVCCCCKRKMKRKMKMAKEVEKPPLRDDEIYTIGVAPPVYEVNGIPPMYYEKAKGEKISSRSSAVQDGADVAPEATQM